MRLQLMAFLTAVFLLPGMSNTVLKAQDPNLANQYFMDGEYEKAATLYGQLADQDENNEYFFNRLMESLLNLEKYEDGEKIIKKRLKKMPDNVMLYVTYGGFYERQEKEAEATEQYDKAISKMSGDYASVTRLANTFINNSKFDLAVKTYERGATLMKDANRFAYNLGDLYQRKGETDKMINCYLNALSADPGKLAAVQTRMARFLAPSDYTTLQTQLYERVQKEENPDLVELLAWSFVQRKDFKSAFRQYKALDQRLGENGQRLFKLAEEAADARDFDVAISAYDYIVAEKGPLNPFFFDSKQAGMECRRRKITEGFAYTPTDLQTLETEYENFLTQYGKSRQTSSIIIQLADLEAYYVNNLPKAIALLEEMKVMPGLDRYTLARTKINLGDYYLMSGDIWESTLLFSQVDKDFKEEQIGQEARFKNARLSYFNGDFQWAQAQFDVLKASTSKLIANDALDLSVFIMDNLNLDTTSDAIALYSGAEMLVFQNRFEDAFLKLDTLQREFPEHSLQDDILYLKAQIFEKKRDYASAIALYQEIVDKFGEEIRADNALYTMAQLYETKMNDPEKAQALYEKVFIDYSGSVFAVDARKRFRLLRGDKMQ